jgi:hypothetical protein
MVAVRDRIDGWWNPAGATQRLQSGPWSHRKDFLGVKNKPFSRGHVSVCLDLADVVIDGMTTKGRRERWWGATVRVWAKANLAEGAEAGRAQKLPQARPLKPKGREPAKAKREPSSLRLLDGNERQKKELRSGHARRKLRHPCIEDPPLKSARVGHPKRQRQEGSFVAALLRMTAKNEINGNGKFYCEETTRRCARS